MVILDIVLLERTFATEFLFAAGTVKLPVYIVNEIILFYHELLLVWNLWRIKIVTEWPPKLKLDTLIGFVVYFICL